MFDTTDGHAPRPEGPPPEAARVLELLAAREQLEADLLGAFGNCLAARAWEGDGALSPVAWLVHRGELLRGDAIRLVRSAQLCRDHQPIGSSLAAGRIRTDHVRTLARVQHHRKKLFADHVDTLVDAAESVDTTSFETVARRWAAYADDQTDTRNEPPESWLDAATTLNGSVRLAGHLDPEGGAAVLAALAALETPPRPGDPRPASARRADALVALARGATTTAHLDVHVDLATLAGLQPDEAPGDLTAYRHDLDRIGPVRPSTIRRLACDAILNRLGIHRDHPELIDLGHIDLGRRSRVISPKLRRALIARDGGCSIAGCDRPHHWCDAHHIVHWADGGNTDLENLVLLCRRHHTQVHEHHGHLVRGPDGYVIEPP
ncbi:MAG: DUF222 domain-containing protein [Acidimicrobiia bacterium]